MALAAAHRAVVHIVRPEASHEMFGATGNCPTVVFIPASAAAQSALATDLAAPLSLLPDGDQQVSFIDLLVM